MDSKEYFQYKELKELLLGITKPRDQALLTIMYASAGRSEEIIRVKKESFSENNNFLLISLWTAKNRRHPTRIIPVDKNKEEWITSLINDYISIQPNERLFPISTRRVRTISRKWLGQRSHLLRHSRLTHWAAIFRIPLNLFWTQAGWSSQRPATTYIHMNWQDMGKFLSSADSSEINE